MSISPKYHTYTTCKNKTSHNKVHQVQGSKLIVAQYVQNVHLWLKHRLTSVFAIGQLHQSATAPGCTTQLRDVRGLPILIRWLSEPVSCN